MHIGGNSHVLPVLIFLLILVDFVTIEVLSMYGAPTGTTGQNTLSTTMLETSLNITCSIAIIQWPCLSYRAWLSKLVSDASTSSEE